MRAPVSYPSKDHSPQEIQQILETAAKAFPAWSKTALSEREILMRKMAELLEAEAEQLAMIITAEMGKPLRAACEEVLKCARACSYYAQNAGKYLCTAEVDGPSGRNFIRYDPLGTVLAIMPWNFPFWQVFRFAAPSLMAGNVGLLKHASNVPGCSHAIEALFAKAGFPGGVFQSLLIPSREVKAIIHDPRIAAVTITGSVPAGRSVASEAGAALKKTVLELGGSDPFLILPSADLDRAVETAVQSRIVNSGQSCIAAKRFIIHEAIYDQVEQAMVDRMGRLVVGDPMDSRTEVGPLATPSIADEVEAQVKDALQQGARLLVGGKRLDQHYFEPTVLSSIPESARVYREEVFGPVALLFKARDLDHAIALANDSEFGLGAAAWTREENEQRRLAMELNAGMVFINGMVASDPRIPFGGIKSSGYGRELGAIGIHEFVNIKTVCMNPV